MSYLGEVDVELNGESAEAEVRYIDLVRELEKQFNKTEDEIKEFFGMKSEDMYRKYIYFDDASLYGRISVSNDDISEISDYESRYDQLASQYDNYVNEVERLLRPLGDWYYIEEGRQDSSKIGRMVGEIVKKLNL